MSQGLVSGSNLLVSRYAIGTEPISPVDPEFLKAHIQLTHDLDDELVLGVSGYMWAAVEEIENRGSVALIEQTRQQFLGPELLPDPSGCTIALTRGPYRSNLVVKYLDANEVTQTLASTAYRITPTGDVYFKSKPEALAEGPGTIWLEYKAGYGTTPDAVPASWKSLICMVAMRLYDYRGSAPKDSDAFERMLDRHVVAAGGNRRY